MALNEEKSFWCIYLFICAIKKVLYSLTCLLTTVYPFLSNNLKKDLQKKRPKRETSM